MRLQGRIRSLVSGGGAISESVPAGESAAVGSGGRLEVDLGAGNRVSWRLIPALS